MIRVGFIVLSFLLMWSACRKTQVLPVPIDEKQVEGAPDPISLVPVAPNPDPEPPASVQSLFKIGRELGVRAGVCEDGNCKAVALDILKGSPGFTEGIVLKRIILKENVLLINSDLSKNLTGFIYNMFKSRKMIMGIPLVLDNPDEQIQDLTFKVAITGITPAMQIGFYDGLIGNPLRKNVKGLKGFTRTNVITEQPPIKTLESGVFLKGPVDGTYYLMLHISLKEVKEMYDKVKSGTEIRFKITGAAEGYSEDIETIDVRLE